MMLLLIALFIIIGAPVVIDTLVDSLPDLAVALYKLIYFCALFSITIWALFLIRS